MFNLKKDWLMSFKLIFIIPVSIMVLLGLVFLFTGNVQESIFWEVNYQFVQQFVFLGTWFVCIIPMACFGCVFPTHEKTFSGKVKTNHLPFSVKQLALKGIKLWVLMYPIWLVIATFINVIYEYKAMKFSVWTMATSFSVNSLRELILFTIIKLIFISLLILILDMQVVAGMIISFSKGIKWYTTFIVQLVTNFIIFFISMFIINRVMDTTQNMIWIGVLGGILFICSLIYFLYSMKFIEKVYR